MKRKSVFKNIVCIFCLSTLAACSPNSFNGSGSAANTPPPTAAVNTGDGAPATPPAQPSPPSTPPTALPIDQIAQILMTMTADGGTEIKRQVDLNQSAKTYQASFSEKILNIDIGHCDVTGAAGDFTKLEQALKGVRINDPNGTSGLPALVTTILKVVFLDGTSLTVQLNLNDDGSVSSSVPTAQANELVAYIDSLQADTATCNFTF